MNRKGTVVGSIYPWPELQVDETRVVVVRCEGEMASSRAVAHSFWKRHGGKVETVSFFNILIVTRVQ